MREWCGRVREAAGIVWRYLRVDQAEFHKLVPDSPTLKALIARIFDDALS